MRCPNCGQARLFVRFLKVANQCPNCDEELHHHRADDAPSYFVILIVGHLIVGLVVLVEATYHPPYWVHIALWLPLTLGPNARHFAACQGCAGGTAVGTRYAWIRSERWRC